MEMLAPGRLPQQAAQARAHGEVAGSGVLSASQFAGNSRGTVPALGRGTEVAGWVSSAAVCFQPDPISLDPSQGELMFS